MSPAVPQQQCASSLLLALPEPLLLGVLQCLAAADDHRSLLSAARAPSRLHQAAAAVLTSVTVKGVACWRRQWGLDAVLLYLGKHGQHVHNINLRGVRDGPPTLCELPSTLQLHSLELHNFELQLGAGCRGVLTGAGVSALKQLRLDSCVLWDGSEGLAEALEQLPDGLEHLSMHSVWQSTSIEGDDPIAFPTSVLQEGPLQQLTYLELWDVLLQAADEASPVLQPLQALSRLVDLRLAPLEGFMPLQPEGFVTASMLSGATGLTRLELAHLGFEPGVLVGKTQLQYLRLYSCSEVPEEDAAAWAQQLLPQLQPLLQLTYLGLPACDLSGGTPASCSALTASSKLQHLGLSRCTLPAGAWQHVFPAGRQLPHLTSLQAWSVRQGTGGCMAAPEGSRLVSCCPALRSLDVRDLRYGTGALSSLQGLSGLHTLLASTHARDGLVFGEVCQLTGLRELEWQSGFDDEPLLLRASQLKQLTRLTFQGPHNNDLKLTPWVLAAQDSDDEPVWRQVLRAHLDHDDPALAQQAAAALAEAE